MTSALNNELPPTSNVTYFLPSNEAERARLAMQHNFLLKEMGGKLVHAPVTLDGESSVLESATGSGIWLQDLAKIMPTSIKLVGTDIEKNLFPDPSTLPSSLQFQAHSVLDLPNEWKNKFDLVHQRLLFSGLRDAEWPKALEEIYRVLKPGGWLQMFEVDDWEQSGPKLTMFKKLFTRLLELRGIQEFWPNGSVKWQRCAKEAGFVDLRATWHYLPIGEWAGQDGIYGKKNKLGVLRGSKEAMMKLGIVDERDFDELLERTGQEMDSYPGARTRHIMICAQKPMLQ